MINFDLKETAIYQAVKWAGHPAFGLAKPLKKLFLVLFIFTLSIFIYGFLSYTFSQSSLQFFLGLLIIFLTLTIALQLKLAFFNSKLKKPRLEITLEEGLANPEEYNLAEILSFETARAVQRSLKFAKSKKFPEINSSILFYFLLKDNPKLNFIFSRAILSLVEIKKILESHFKPYETQPRKEISGEPFSVDFQDTVLESLKIAQKKGHQRIELGDVISALSKHDLIFKEILIQANLKVEDIENLTWWLESLEEKIGESKKFWEWKNLIKKGSLAKEWAAGYTLTLDRFSIDWSEIVKKQGFPEIIGHQREIEAVERILSRRESKNNILIVGESGSGRKSMIQALATRSVLGESLPEVNYKRIVQLDLASLLAQVGSQEKVEVILDQIFREAVTAGNVILVIDEFHNYVGLSQTTPRPGIIDISGVISSYLSLIPFQIVAITTFEGLHKNIEQNPSILSLFEKVEVSEISKRETLMLLENLTLILEAKYRKFVTYPALRDIINYCAKYMPAIPFPEKAMNLLDEAMVYITQTKDKVLLPEYIAKIVTEKTQIPVGEIEIKEIEILLNLENLIHQRIINQEEAVSEVSAALRRARAEVTIRQGPMGCFLFLGPTGVGKTETSKALAEIYFGGKEDKSSSSPFAAARVSEERMIRLDMSEFQNVTDIPRLIGSPGEEGLLTTQVREKPFSLILLDEIEKAHPNILNLFLQVLDEGHLTDGLGRKVDFKNSINIATSNAGYQVILEAIKEKTEWSGVKQKLLDYLFEKGIFRPEFINRFDAFVVFKPLTKENLLDIAELLLQKLKKNLKEKGIEFIITLSLKEKITELGYDPVFGARQMRRTIQDKVENVLASALLSGALKRGNRVEIEPEEFKLIINP